MAAGDDNSARGDDSSFESRWRDRFHRFAEQGDDDAAIAGWSPGGLDARVRNFERTWKPRNAGCWLDVGCGAGTYSRILAQRGQAVIGMDYSLPTLAKARARSGQVSAWCVADVNRLPVRPGSFDGAICFGVSQALSDSRRAVAELARSVKPGGEVWIDALNAWCLPSAIGALVNRARGIPARLRHETPASLARVMKAEGLVRVRRQWVPILPGSLQRLQPVMESTPVRGTLRLLPFLGALLSHAFVMVGERPDKEQSR